MGDGWGVCSLERGVCVVCVGEGGADGWGVAVRVEGS